ncbi:MAG: Ig-like domain-containing protein, partial [Paludibacteraceae bacterium]|nr:Ig-like domain-containing protein [Paludibacteraceae bacterium]
RPRKNTRDVYRPINRGVVELWQNDKLLKTYVTDTLYNGCYFFWNLQPGTYTVKAKPEGYYSQEEVVEVKKNEISYALFAMSLKRQTPPEVTGYTPKVESLEDSVQVSVQPTISFNWDMEKEATAAALTISPEVEGTVVFEDDNRTLRFVPATRFEPGVEYTITLGTGACHPDSSVVNNLQEPFSFKFRTQNRGSVRVIQTYPAKDEVNVPVNASFVVLFDAKVVANKVKSNVAVLDAAGKELAINSRSFKLNTASAPYGSAGFELVAELAPNSQYSLVLKPGISDVDGVLLNETMTIPFTTGEKVTSELPLVDDMEVAFFDGDKENSVETKSAIAQRDVNKKYAGSASNQLKYEFTAPDGQALFNALNPTLIIANSESRLGMYVFGDYSFNELYARWAVEGDIQYTKICDLDYAGWLFQEADMAALPAGVDYQFMGLQIIRKDGLMSQTGAIYIDNLCADKITSGSTAVEDVVVEESANGKFIENGYLHILFNGVKYNAEGKLIK